ncbi:hypothetical protein TNCV_4099641 [Trichonephila clavipes]|nr:hypothetical protein TNCV_4099641 [Trichonephila clavipes]
MKEENERIRQPSTSCNAENVAFLSQYVRKNSQQTLAQINEATHFSKTSFEGISSGRVMTDTIWMKTHQHINPN